MVAICQDCISSRDDKVLWRHTDSRCGGALRARVAQLIHHLIAQRGNRVIDACSVGDA